MNKLLFLSVLITLICSIFLIPSNTYSSPKEDYELQDKCGKRCEEIFKEKFGNGIINDKDQIGHISYQNHYSKKLNKCFLLLNQTTRTKSDDKIFINKSLWDVNENKKYGTFVEIGENKFCEVLNERCKSEGEWNKLVKPYMEE